MKTTHMLLLPLLLAPCFTKEPCTSEVCQLRPSGGSCGSGRGRLVEIGDKGSGGSWRTLFTACHNVDSGEPLFANHTLQPHNGSESSSGSSNNFKIGRKDLYPANVSISSLYTRASQQRRFKRLLGSRELAEQLVSGKSFLARGHLAPAADFASEADQDLTYHYVNVAPMWQQVNGGNWKSVESAVRRAAKERNLTLQVLTGVMGTMSVEDARGRNKELTLADGRVLPVPKYFWKLVYDPRNRKAIAFVVLNDPFRRNVQLADRPCKESVCDEAGWRPSSRSWSTLARGYVFCCEVSALRKSARQVPAPPGPVNGLLAGPYCASDKAAGGPCAYLAAAAPAA